MKDFGVNLAPHVLNVEEMEYVMVQEQLMEMDYAYVIKVGMENTVINVIKIILEIIAHIVTHVLMDIVMIQCMEMEVAFVTIILKEKIVTNA